MTGEDIVREAREWKGTPFKWQASLKGVGCDCKGLVWGVARELGLPEADSIHAKVADYETVDTRRLLRGMQETFRRVRELAPGCVVLINTGERVQHMGIVTPRELIHASMREPKAVVVTPLIKFWRDRIVSIWTWPSLEN